MASRKHKQPREQKAATEDRGINTMAEIQGEQGLPETQRDSKEIKSAWGAVKPKSDLETN